VSNQPLTRTEFHQAVAALHQRLDRLERLLLSHHSANGSAEEPAESLSGKSRPLLHLWIRRRRQHLHLRQSDIAEALAVSPESVALWEAGRRRIDLSRIPLLAQVLQLDPRQLGRQALAESYPRFHRSLFDHPLSTAAQNPSKSLPATCES